MRRKRLFGYSEPVYYSKKMTRSAFQGRTATKNASMIVLSIEIHSFLHQNFQIGRERTSSEKKFSESYEGRSTQNNATLTVLLYDDNYDQETKEKATTPTAEVTEDSEKKKVGFFLSSCAESGL